MGHAGEYNWNVKNDGYESEKSGHVCKRSLMFVSFAEFLSFFSKNFH